MLPFGPDLEIDEPGNTPQALQPGLEGSVPPAQEHGQAVIPGYALDLPLTFDEDLNLLDLPEPAEAATSPELDPVDTDMGFADLFVEGAAPAVLDRTYSFQDPATPAVLAAIPPSRPDGPMVLTDLQLRSLVATAILSLNDMSTATPVTVIEAKPVAPAGLVLKSVAAQVGIKEEPLAVVDDGIDDDDSIKPLARATVLLDEEDLACGIVALPPAKLIAERVGRVIDEMKTIYLRQIDRVDNTLDQLDRAVKANGFASDHEWTKVLVEGAPNQAYTLTPEGIAVGRMIRRTNAGEITGMGGDLSRVILPGVGEGEDALARVTFASVEAFHALLLDHFYEAGLLKPHELGAMLAREAAGIRDSLRANDNHGLDVAGGRILSNLGAVSEATRAFLLEEEVDRPVGEFPLTPSGIRQTVQHTVESCYLAPRLALDGYILEQLQDAVAAETALKIILGAQIQSGVLGLISPSGDEDSSSPTWNVENPYADKRVWQHSQRILKQAPDTRLAAIGPDAADRCAANGINPLLADAPLVYAGAIPHEAANYVGLWLRAGFQGNDAAFSAAFDAFSKSLPTVSPVLAAS